MRKAILFRSVNRALDSDERVIEAVYMWARHRWMVPYAIVAFVALFVVADLVGFTQVSAQIALGIAGAAVAVAATTDYRVVAWTERGLYLFKASRIRRFASALIEELPEETPMTRLESNVIASDWEIGDRRYTLTRSNEQAMNRIASQAG